MQKDFFNTTAKTEIKARVKSKKENQFLRYNSRTGAVRQDSHFETVFKLPNGDEVTSYSKKHFTDCLVGKYYQIKVSWVKMPDNRFLLFI